MENVWIAVVVAVSSIFTTAVAPLLMAFVVGRIQQHSKQEDYARQDIVAARAEKTATRAAQKAEESAVLLLAANERVAKSTKITNEKLDTIHTLVNSNMTAAMQSELDATMREAAVMNELIELKKGIGYEPTIEALSALKAANDRIRELKAILKDRLDAAAAAAGAAAAGAAAAAAAAAG